MTRFIYLSDTHFGASGLGYHQGKPYPEKLPEIVAALSAWIKRAPPISFVLHGGDLVDVGSPALIGQACEQFRLPVPTYLCLGNHDLSQQDSLETWLKLGSALFPAGAPNFTIEAANCAVHVIPNQWGKIPYYWAGENRPTPAFLPEQIDFFEQSCQESEGKIQILLTHSPVWGPPDHQPGGGFQEIVAGMTANHPGIRYVLGAHCHLNSTAEYRGVQYRTSAALVETPFEFNVFEVGADGVRIETVSLAPFLSKASG